MDTPTQTMPESHSTPAAAPASSPGNRLHAHLLRRNDPRVRLYFVLGLLALVIVGVFLWRYFASYESTDDAQIDGHVSSISARVSGHVIKLNVQDNQYVEAGTVLVEIDPTDYQIAVARAQADYNDAKAAADAAAVNVPVTSVNTASQLSSADADVLNAQAGIKAAHQQFDAAKAALAQAEANNVKVQNDLVRYRQLVGKQEISQQQYDQAVAAAKAGAAAVEAARATADAAQAQVAQAESKLAQDLAKLNLSYTRIVAPAAGVVSNRTVEVGQNVQAGQALLNLIPLDDIWVTANFKETQLREMKPGQKATIYVDASGKKYRGHVDSIAGASGARFSLLPPENATGNYVKVVQRIPVKIVFEPGETRGHEMRPGMSVEPTVWIRP